MFNRRHWIAPGALIYAQLAHGLSWVVIIMAARSGNFENPLWGLAWIHAVALAWVTMTALAILIFAIPQFTDVPWRAQSVARWSLVAYGIGVALLLYAFFSNAAPLFGPAGSLILAALLVYLTTAFATLAQAGRGERVQRAVARAFGGTFGFLFATVVLGFALAWMIGGASVPAWVARFPFGHADLGTLGWLTLLIFGVSMRTLRPITGDGTRMRFMHVVVGLLALAGIPLLAAGASAGYTPLAMAGGALFALAALGYLADAFDVLLRARNPHRTPQAFIAAALLWLIVALVLGGGVLAGEPWQRAYVFVLLAGWVGQMVNGHIHHIGIRLLATIYRGEDDETAPQELLLPRLSVFAFVTLQAGVALVLIALLQDHAVLAFKGAIIGGCGWVAMIANILAARHNAQRPIE